MLLGWTATAQAHPVGKSLAREVAVKFMNANTKTLLQGVDDLLWVTTYSTDRGEAAFHVFNAPNGFVIVSADDCATPILGYATTGQFDPSDLPPAMEAYLRGFVEQIEYGIKNHLEANESIARQWEWVRTSGRLHDSRDGETVDPLLTAMWGQGCYYNAMCPENANGQCGHVLTGCAATAMGMIMHYWGYPSQGSGTNTYTPPGYPEQSVNFGETTYDWANMPDQLTETSTQEETDAVSTLLWHCGVAINTRYGPLNSTAFADLIPTVLVDCFNYSDEVFFPTDLVYDENLSLWLTLIKNDLYLGRPILYLGANPNDGHAWVCDGIDAQDLLHFNWGWNGQNNGYYSLYAGIGYAMQNAIFGIFPDAGQDITTQATVLAQGWNWWSTNVGVTLADLQEALVEALPDSTNIVIKSKDGGSTTYNGTHWRGTLDSLDITQMYMLTVPDSCEITLVGAPIVPAEHPITIKNGVNWIAYPLTESMSLTDAFAGFAVSGDQVKSKDNGYATYTDRWRGTLTTLEPGQGYIFRSNSQSNRTLVFPTRAK